MPGTDIDAVMQIGGWGRYPNGETEVVSWNKITVGGLSWRRAFAHYEEAVAFSMPIDPSWAISLLSATTIYEVQSVLLRVMGGLSLNKRPISDPDRPWSGLVSEVINPFPKVAGS